VEVKVGRGDPTQTAVESSLRGEDAEPGVVLHQDWGLERVSSRGPTAHEDDKLCHALQYASYFHSPPISDKTMLSATRDGRSLIAIGCVEGVWVGDVRGPQCECSAYGRLAWSLTRYRTAFHHILPLQMIRQCAVLEEFGLVLILAQNVCPFHPTQPTCPDVIHPAGSMCL